MRGFHLVALWLALLWALGQATPARQSCSLGQWTGVFFNSADFSGPVVAQTCAPTLAFDWGVSEPLQGVRSDNFSVRWTSVQRLPLRGRYLFTLTVEDGARLRLNEQTLINDLGDSPGPQTFLGRYEAPNDGMAVFLMLEMVSYTGNASLNLTWSLAEAGSNSTLVPNLALTTATPSPTAFVPPTAPPITPTPIAIEAPSAGDEPWEIVYFPNPDLAGEVRATAEAPPNGISRNWGFEVPATDFPSDNWSARWRRRLTLPANRYTFTLRADDAAVFRINGQEVLRQDAFAGGASFVAEVELPEGEHVFEVDFIERGESADLFLTWQPPIGTTLSPDGCNGETAGINGSAAQCDEGLSAGGGLLVTVQAGPLYVRVSPDSEARALFLISEGQTYQALRRTADNAWVELNIEGKTGWSRTDFLRPQGPWESLPIFEGG